MPLTSELDALCGGNAHLGPTGYTPCEDAFGVGATHPTSLCDALTEQSALVSLMSKLIGSTSLDYVASGSNRSA